MRVFQKRPFLLSVMMGFLISSLSYFFQPLFPVYSIAHRGASSYAPENTMAAFQQAVERGFDYIELDVRMSRDNELVVIHDEDVERTTDGVGLVQDLTVYELQELDAGTWFDPSFSEETIPTLTEVLAQFGGKVGLVLDIKAPDSNKLIMEKLSQYLYSFMENGGNPKTIKVQSFHINEIERFHQLCPEISTGVLLSKPLDLFHLSSYRHFASFISVHHQLLSKSFINQAKHFDYEIFSWTIQNQLQFIAMQKLKVHGIISNEEKKNLTIHPFLAFYIIEKGQRFLKNL